MRKRSSKVKARRRARIYTVFLVLIVIPVVFLVWWTGNLKPFSDSDQKYIFDLKPGMTASQVAAELEKNKIIQNAKAFEQLSKIKKADSRLVAGEYYLSPSMSVGEILDILVQGPEPEIVKVTIPEGFTLAEIINTMENNGLGTKEKYYQAIKSVSSKDYDFLKDIPSGENRLEGFLFPDTYFFDKKASEIEVIERFLQRFSRELTDETRNKLKEMNMSVYDWVIKASIVEREAVKAEERPLIAGIFENRLKKGMPLQSCATVQYLLGEVKPVLSLDDLEIESPYNTYKYSGLPPGPISNPGHASLQAALNPSQTNYLYFVAKNDGSHAFAVTFEQHLKNIRLINNYQDT